MYVLTRVLRNNHWLLGKTIAYNVYFVANFIVIN